ncbi:MAG: Rpn family recombination-promoting nuclease/putative transposase, partial [Clostridia bacterium]
RYKNKNYKYPVVIPIVLYTGNKKWNAELDLSKILLEKWKKYKGQEFSKYNIFDVNEIDNEDLLKEESIISKLIIIEKSKTKEEFFENTDKISKEFKTKEIIYTKDSQKFFVNALMTIVQNLFDDVDIDKKIQEIAKEVDDPMMQVLEMLKRDIYKANQEAKEEARKEAIKEGRIEGRKEGRKEGKKEGRIEGKINIIKNMLKENIPLSVISSVSGITQSEIKKLVK